MEHKFLVFPCELKATDDKGTFEGYGSVFGNIDAYKEIVEPGAFRESLETLGLPSMLWQHNPDQPIGVYTEVREDETGLFVKGQINLDVQSGKEGYSLLKQGALRGLSIGFRTRKREYDEDQNVVRLKQVDLYEVSLVTFPANRLATVDKVKSLPDNERDFEKFLRDAGYSRSDAKRITACGFKGSDDLRDADAEELISVLDKFIK
jgi:HK97 family phage prohead protease